MIRELPHRCTDLQSDGMHEEVIATIPQERQDLVLEVALMHSGTGNSEVELRSLVWGNGLGWYRQSTLRLDGATGRKLLGALGSVRRRLEPTEVVPSPSRQDAKILAFPGTLKAAAGSESEDAPASLAR